MEMALRPVEDGMRLEKEQRAARDAAISRFVLGGEIRGGTKGGVDENAKTT
jgi:hypothetical protein